MRIEELHVQNFRCFQNRSWSFTPNFNVLIGDNGTGKTALLRALRIGLGAFLPGFKTFKFIPIEFDDRRMTWKGSDENPVPEHARTVSVEFKGVIEGKLHNWSRQIKQGDGKNSGRTLSIRRVAEGYDNAILGDAPPVLPMLAFYPASRMWKRGIDAENKLYIKLVPGKGVIDRSPSDYEDITEDEIGQPTSRLAGYRSAFSAQANEEELRRWLARMELSELQRGKPNATLGVVKNAVISSVDGWGNYYYDVVTKETVVKKNNGDIIPTRLLSDGHRNVLSITADIAFRCVSLNPELGDKAPEKTPGVVLIDEIDMHLHPKLQRQIVDNLKRTFPNIQFIVTTHSPIIIQSLKATEDQVIDLSGEKFPLTVSSSPEDILERMGLEIPQKSLAWLRLFHAAERYYRLLDEAKQAQQDNHNEELARLRQELDAVSIRYEDNPAWAALLERKRAAAGIDPEDIEV